MSRDERANTNGAFDAERLRLLEQVVNTMPYLMAMVDRDYRYLLVNRAYADLLGLSRQQIVGLCVEELLGPELFHGEIKAYLDRCLSGEDVSFEIHLELPGVDKRWMQVRYCPYRDRDDAVAGVLSHAVDITDRKRAGFDFADKSTELENILNALPDAIVYADAERRIRKVNPAFVRLFGYEPDEVLGQTTRFIYTSDEAYAEQGRLRYNVDARDMTEPYEIDYRRKDGSTFVSETVGTPVLNARGKVVGLMALIRDITGRKDTERRLAELRHLMDYVIQHDPNAIAVYDNDLNYIYVSQRYLDDYRVPDPNIVGKHHYEVFPEIPERWRDIHRRVLAGAIERCEEDYFDRPDGTRDYNRWECRPWYTPGGEIGGMITYTEVITERHEMEARLRQAEKMDAIGQLAGGIAHDFNNQLSGIMGYGELLTKRIEDPRLRQYAEKIMLGARRAADLTGQLLAYARKGQYRKATVDMHETIDEVTAILGHSIDKRIAVRRSLEADPPRTLGDPSQLQNMLLNLALNARDAMPGGGELLFETRAVDLDPAHVAVALDAKPGRCLEVSVIDSGCGMDEVTCGRIFEPFFTTKDQGKGTGMGLAAVYGTVKQHHGAIDIESAPGRGTAIRVYLPLIEGESEPVEEGREIVAARREARILVVDDESLFRDLAVDMLHSVGYSVLTAEDGQAGLDFYREHWRAIDLVILDMIMPRLSGADTWRGMKAINPNVRALLASGYSREGEAQTLLNDGVSGFLQKPFRQAELTRMVDEALGRDS